MFTNFLKICKMMLFNLLLIILFSIGLLAQIPDGYYDEAAGKTGYELKTALYNIIKGHSELSYDAAYDALEVTDRDSINSQNVIMLYTGRSRNAALQYDNGAGWNREHVWAKSRGDFGTSLGAGTDLHHLRAADVSTNSTRNNRWFDYSDTPHYDDGSPTGNYYSDSKWSWEPRDAVKGDVSRMIFYMATRYEGENGEPDLEIIDYFPSDKYTKSPVHAKLSALLEWHEQDPVDNWERRRNNTIYSNYQHNRNPYIDHPEYVALIWGNNPPPVSPTNLCAADITQSSITLTWDDNSADEDGFIIFIDGFNFDTVSTNVTLYTAYDLSPSTRYTFNIASYNDNGISLSAGLTVRTLPDSNAQTANDSLFFSEYIEGSSYNKALEIVNASAHALPLYSYYILSGTNGGSWNDNNYSFPENTILQPGEVFVLVNKNSDPSLKDVADDSSFASVINFTGDDVRALVSIDGIDTTIIDIIGLYNGIDPGDGWPVAGIDNATANHTLVRKSSVRHGNSDWLSSAGTNANDSEWLILAEDTFDYLGSHTVDSVNAVGFCNAPYGPDDYLLYGCYPNPFNPVTSIRYEIRQTANITLRVYDLRGHVVKTLIEAMQPAGSYTVTWNATDDYHRNVSAGVYLYRLQTDNGFVRTGKMVLIK